MNSNLCFQTFIISMYCHAVIEFRGCDPLRPFAGLPLLPCPAAGIRGLRGPTEGHPRRCGLARWRWGCRPDDGSLECSPLTGTDRFLRCRCFFLGGGGGAVVDPRTPPPQEAPSLRGRWCGSLEGWRPPSPTSTAAATSTPRPRPVDVAWDACEMGCMGYGGAWICLSPECVVAHV